MKKGDLSKFIEEAVRWRVLQRTIQDIRARNADADRMKSSASSAKPSARSA
jgi:Ribbon-helix-helix domain